MHQLMPLENLSREDPKDAIRLLLSRSIAFLCLFRHARIIYRPFELSVVLYTFCYDLYLPVHRLRARASMAPTLRKAMLQLQVVAVQQPLEWYPTQLTRHARGRWGMCPLSRHRKR